MADEAAMTIVARFRDEASDKMKTLGKGITTTNFSAQQLHTTLIATGSALTAIGSLLSRVGGESGKAAGMFIMSAGAILSTVSAIMTALPAIRTMIATLRALTITQTILNALTGPIGWGKIAIGLGVAAAATAGIYALSRDTGGGAGSGTSVVQFNSQAFTGSKQDARKFSRQMNTIAREDTRLGR